MAAPINRFLSLQDQTRMEGSLLQRREWPPVVSGGEENPAGAGDGDGRDLVGPKSREILSDMCYEAKWKPKSVEGGWDIFEVDGDRECLESFLSEAADKQIREACERLLTKGALCG